MHGTQKIQIRGHRYHGVKREKHDPFMKMGVDILRVSVTKRKDAAVFMTLQTRHVSLLVLARSKDGQSWVPGRGCSIAVVEGWW
jgi:hypothetical protein